MTTKKSWFDVHSVSLQLRRMLKRKYRRDVSGWINWREWVSEMLVGCCEFGIW